MTPTSAVQLIGPGSRLPDTVDVWLRASSHPRGEPIHRLNVRPALALRIDKTSLALHGLHRGSLDFISTSPPDEPPLAYEMKPFHRSTEPSFTAVFDFKGTGDAARYQVCAVRKDGRKIFPDVPHFVDFQRANPTEIIHFRFDLDDLSHFEWRPFGGRHTFYFEGLRLPQVSPGPFAPSPRVLLAVDGKETSSRISTFDPIQVSLQLQKGEGLRSLLVDGRVPSGKLNPNLDSAFTAYLFSDGAIGSLWIVNYYDHEGNRIDLSSSRKLLVVWTNVSRRLKCATVRIPLNRVGSVEIGVAR